MSSVQRAVYTVAFSRYVLNPFASEACKYRDLQQLATVKGTPSNSRQRESLATVTGGVTVGYGHAHTGQNNLLS